MNDNTRHIVIKAFRQASLLLTVSIAVGLLINIGRSDGIPIMGDWSLKTRFKTAEGGQLSVSLEEAVRLCKDKKAIFIDARSQQDFAAGHIKCALNLPWQSVDEHFLSITDKIDAKSMIITYCDGETCSLSKDLASFLYDVGFENVKVLVNGWSVWQGKGLPIGSS